jgi:hypothetical protein
MADNAPTRTGTSLKDARQKQGDQPACGVIMPISATTNHSEEHWGNVQTLLHRGISAAGFSPQNVWESASKDRISERIIGNIFQTTLAVVDVSDLNPNVMLELGLRLASKKPTVVVANSGEDIPFDIRDFHAVFYPADMNMLGMEDFFRRLSKALQDKHTAYVSDTYTPFLGHVIVDVASPETREVGFNELLFSRLDDITNRLSSVEISVKRPRVIGSTPRRPRPDLTSGTITVEIPDDQMNDFANETFGIMEIDGLRKMSIASGVATVEIRYSGADDYAGIYNIVSRLAQKYGGDVEVPF